MKSRIGVYAEHRPKQYSRPGIPPPSIGYCELHHGNYRTSKYTSVDALSANPCVQTPSRCTIFDWPLFIPSKLTYPISSVICFIYYL